MLMRLNVRHAVAIDPPTAAVPQAINRSQTTRPKAKHKSSPASNHASRAKGKLIVTPIPVMYLRPGWREWLPLFSFLTSNKTSATGRDLILDQLNGLSSRLESELRPEDVAQFSQDRRIFHFFRLADHNGDRK